MLWGDFESATSFIESDTSHAGRATVAVGETILNAAPLGNWLMLYTDKSIWRVTLVGGEDVFSFERIYQGGNALSLQFSLINGGDIHLYLGESDVYALSQFDSRPITVPWITKASGMIFNGIVEDHATYDPINKDACNLVTGGWSEETHEAFLSWPTGDRVCPNVTLRFNMKFQAADFIDHGFTSFLTFRMDNRPTIGQFLEDLGVCARGTLSGHRVQGWRGLHRRRGSVPNPPLFIWNETENPAAPIHPRSICALLQGKTLADFCEDCATGDDLHRGECRGFYAQTDRGRCLLPGDAGGNYVNYDGYACDGEFYEQPWVSDGDAAGPGELQERGREDRQDDRDGSRAADPDHAQRFDDGDWLRRPAVSNCTTWRTAKILPYECLTFRTPAQRVRDSTRPDATFYFPVWRRGRFLAARFILDGLGGGGMFSAMSFMIQSWGQQDNP